MGGSAVRNGVEIASTEDLPVRAVHGGTVAYADAFTGLGTLVILDHGGNNYSLYGYLGAVTVQTGGHGGSGRAKWAGSGRRRLGRRRSISSSGSTADRSIPYNG